MGVHKWITEVPHRAFWSLAQVCKEGRLDNEEVPRWTKNAKVKFLSQILEDHEARNDFTQSIMWRSTDFLRHVVGDVEESGDINFTYVCEPRKKNLWRTSSGE